MELLTVAEAARELRVSQVTVRRFIARGALKSVKVGRQRRVEREAVERFICGTEPSATVVSDELADAKPFTLDDPLWGLVGIARSDGPGDVSANKHKYLADAYLESHTGD